jgi:hypothetical protein
MGRKGFVLFREFYRFCVKYRANKLLRYLESFTYFALNKEELCEESAVFLNVGKKILFNLIEFSLVSSLFLKFVSFPKQKFRLFPVLILRFNRSPKFVSFRQ